MNDKKPASAIPEPRTGLKRLIAAFNYSIAGLTSTFRTESAFRQEIAAFIVLFPAALWLGETNVERAVLIGPLFVVLAVEILNTAVENIVDRLGSEYNELSKAAKNAGSAAVFISLILVLVTWMIVVIR